MPVSYISLDPIQMYPPPPQGVIALVLLGLREENKGKEVWGPRMPSVSSPMLSVLSCTSSTSEFTSAGKKNPLLNPGESTSHFIVERREGLDAYMFLALNSQEIGAKNRNYMCIRTFHFLKSQPPESVLEWVPQLHFATPIKCNS